MGRNNGNHGSRTAAWRGWCKPCGRYLAMLGHHSLWPDEIRCPLCGQWRKVLARGRHALSGDVVCPHGSSRYRVED